MKYSVLRLVILIGICVMVTTSLAKEKPKSDPAAKTVDSGSFGVFQNEKRIATETFSISQNSNGSTATSEFKMDPAVGNAVQSSTLELAPSGEIVRYQWKEISPGNASAWVAPNGDFLTEHYHDKADEKEQEKPFLLPASTSILDDYFFVQREILVWKYLAMACKTQNGVLQCPLKQEMRFGGLNAHSRISVPIVLTFMGQDEITIHGTPKKLSRINLKSDSGDWALWVDEQFKLQQIQDLATGTEIIRD